MSKHAPLDRSGRQILKQFTHRVGHPSGPALLLFHVEVVLNENIGGHSLPMTADMVSPGLNSDSRLSKARRLSITGSNLGSFR